MRRSGREASAVGVPAGDDRADRGATGLEYGLLMAGVALTALLGATALGSTTFDGFSCMSAQMEQSGEAGCSGDPGDGPVGGGGGGTATDAPTTDAPTSDPSPTGSGSPTPSPSSPTPTPTPTGSTPAP